MSIHSHFTAPPSKPMLVLRARFSLFFRTLSATSLYPFFQ